MITTTIEAHKAGSRLPELIRQAHEGVEVILLRGGRPVAKIVPWTPPRPKRRLGAWAGKVQYRGDIVPPDEDLIALFSESAGA